MCVEYSGTGAVITPPLRVARQNDNEQRLARLRPPATPTLGVVKTISILQTPALILINPQLFGYAPSGLLCSRMAHLCEERSSALLSVIKVILVVAAVVLTTANRTYAAHSGAECYLHGHRIYVPDGLNYPRQAWGGWGITCRTAASEIAGSGAIGVDPEGRPAEWCGWWMRQHLGGRYGPELNVARNWLNVGRPLDGPRPGAIGVKAHHVFQVIRVVDRDHVLAISGNDHNDVRTRIRPTSDVIGRRDVTEENTAAEK